MPTSPRVLPALLVITSGALAQCNNGWLAAASSNGTIEAMVAWDPDGPGPQPLRLVLGGAFTNVGGIAAARVAAWDPVSGIWAPLGTGANGTVNDLCVATNGDLLAVGSFTFAGGVPCNGIARWHAGAWQAVGTGLLGFGSNVVETDQGDIVVAGLFTTTAGVQNVASWHAGAWSYTATDVNPGAPSLTKLVDGTVLLSGNAGLFVWSPAGLSGFASLPSPTYALCPLRNGGFVAAGSWLQIGTTTVGYIARWNGTAWSPLGSGLAGGFPAPRAEVIVELPGGDLVVAGSFTHAGGVPCANIARWDGSAWTAFGAGTDATVSDLAFLAQGRLALGGYFANAGGAAAARFALLGTSCPGAVTTTGAGCASSGGNNLLRAVGAPWLGGRFVTDGAGLPASSLALVVHGLQMLNPALPLDLVLPPSPAGCDLHVTPDLLDVVLPTNGVARAELAIPNTSSLLGATVFQQWVPLEFDPSGQLLATTATNTLQLTLGVF